MKLNIFRLLTLAALPSLAAAACEADSTGKFRVIDTAGNLMRSCAWAARAKTESRCQLAQVQWQCETTCGCDEFPLFAAAVTSTGEQDTIPETLIVSLSLLGVALIALLALMVVRSRNKNKQQMFDDDSLGLNDNSGVISVGANEDVLGDISVATETLQTGSFDSCCAPC
jgi:hypothetical protein